MESIDIRTLLRRASASAFLMEAGYPVSEGRLAALAHRGGGPRFCKFGRIPLYRREDLKAWAESQMKPFANSVAECKAAQEAALSSQSTALSVVKGAK